MKIYQMYRHQQLAMSPDQGWDFFSSPRYLNTMTPAFFQVSIKNRIPEAVYPGLTIAYTMKVIWGIPMTWISEISYCQQPTRLVYRQAIGPFRFMSHEVRMTPAPDTGIFLEDIILYIMPLGLLGRVCHKLLVGRKLEQIFDFRAAYLDRHWGVMNSARSSNSQPEMLIIDESPD